MGFSRCQRQAVPHGGVNGAGRRAQRYAGQAAALADTLFACAAKGPAQPSYCSLMVFQVQKAYWLKPREEETYDYRFWKSSGWLEPGRAYYTAVRTNPVKLTFARLAARLVGLFMS